MLKVRASGVISEENYAPRREVLIEITEKVNQLGNSSVPITTRIGEAIEVNIDN